MTQAQLADKVGVSRRTMSNIETCKHEPITSLAIVVAEVLGETVDEVFYVERPKFARNR